MAGTIERIERDLAALGEANSALAAELRSTYSSYLTSLGQTVHRAVILASYHICTQGYAECFLKLSFSQRQQLQKALLKVARQAQEQLLSYLATPTSEPGAAETAGQEWDRAAPSFAPTGDVPATELTNPEQLGQWQENTEQGINHTLQTLSRDGNRLLAQAGILPNQVPEAILEAALKAESPGEAVAGAPNILNLLIETEKSQTTGIPSVTHVMALHLRLTEIEFGDATVMAGRQQIRHLSSRLNTLRREYQKKQRERIISEAQSAWRTSWVDE